MIPLNFKYKISNNPLSSNDECEEILGERPKTRREEFLRLLMKLYYRLFQYEKKGVLYNIEGFFQFHGITAGLAQELSAYLLEIESMEEPESYKKYKPLIESKIMLLKNLQRGNEELGDHVKTDFLGILKERVASYKVLLEKYLKDVPEGNVKFFIKGELEFVQNELANSFVPESSITWKRYEAVLSEYKDFLEEKLLKQKKATRKSDLNIEDIVYWIKIFKDENNCKDTHKYKSVNKEVEKRGYLNVVDEIDRSEVKIYTPELAMVLSSNDLLVENQKSKVESKINCFSYLESYIKAFKEGEKYFKNQIAVSPEVLYGSNAEQYIKGIHDNYYHTKLKSSRYGWVFVKNSFSKGLTYKEVFEYGFYSGIVSCVDSMVEKHKKIFDTFDRCEHNKLEVEHPEIKFDGYTESKITNWLENNPIKGIWGNFPQMMWSEKSELDNYKAYERRCCKDHIKVCEEIIKIKPSAEIVLQWLKEYQIELKNIESEIPIPETNYKDIVESIDNAFFRLENFMNGKKSDYVYFGFNDAFTVLFNETHKSQNYTPYNCELINEYWKLTEQFRVDTDKGNYDNNSIFENKDFAKEAKGLEYLNWDRITEFCEFPDTEDKDDRISITDVLDKRKFPLVKQTNFVEKKERQLILFDKTESVTNFHNLLRGYFPEFENDLMRALKGEHLDNSLLFPHNQNKFVELFRRAKYNGIVTSNSTEIKDWLCRNFQFKYKRGKINEIKSFNPSTVWDILTKGKGEPKKNERICFENIDWLPYKNKAQLDQENQKEQLS